MKVSGLTIFPVKSCQGVDVEKVEIGPFGFKYDRFWVIARMIEGKYEMLTQREYSKMVLIKPTIRILPRIILTLEAVGMEGIEIPLITNESVAITVWDDIVYGHFQGDQAAVWISKFLAIEVKLFAKDLETQRILPKKHTPSKSLLKIEPQTAFADGFPFLLLSEESVTDIKNQHENPGIVSYKTFRPNIIVNECAAFDEDKLISFSINNVVFYGASRCTRCVMTNNDPLTGITNTLTLKLLQKVRRVDPGAKYEGCMGINVIHQTEGGTISIGDKVTILRQGVHDRRGIWNGMIQIKAF
jgi:uncharacterized protein YcbX